MLSDDGYVRIPRAGLRSIAMHHVSSAVDLSIAIPEHLAATEPADMLTGYTEWAGYWEGQTVSLGWDWGLARAGLVLLSADEIRTNIMPVGEASTPTQVDRAALAEWIEVLPWRSTAIPELISSHR
jgi:hypothetical protein